MPDGQLIEFDHVTKRFGAVAAVSDFSARVNPGVVTGFLGPNGAGKTTTLRMLVGLERPTIGTTKIGGTRFSELRNPARVIGAMLEDPGFRARRTVERHLIAAAKSNGIPLSRVGELISFVGLGDDVETRIAALSLGMRQRLSAATALIGDPGVLVLDEPANGLDPEGIRWMRTLIRGLADEGRTVLVSSHVLSEVEQTADEILVIARGELKFAGTMEDLADPSSGPVVVDAADRAALSGALRGAGFEFEVLRSGLTVRGSDAAQIGAVTASAGVALTTLQQRGPTLEDVFLDLVNDRYVRPSTVVADAAPAAVDDLDAPAAEVAEPDAAPAVDTTESAETSEPVDTTGEADETTAGPVEATAPAGSAEPAEPAAPAEPVEGTAGDAETVEASAETAEAPAETDEALAEPAAETDEAPGEPDSAIDESDDSSDHGDDAEAPTPREDDRPLPGIAGLAAVASLFSTPAPAVDAGGDSEIEEAEQPSTEDAGANDDLDATRVIDVVADGGDESTASDLISDAPLATSDENDAETDPTEEFFDAFSGDPASDDDDESSADSAEGAGESDAHDTASHEQR